MAKMIDQVCETCQHWQPIEYGGVCYLDPQRPEPTGGGYSCGDWQPRTTRKPVTVTAPAGPDFDIETAAKKITEAGLPEVSISIVRDVLRCQYRQAALVVSWLEENGLVRAK